MANTIETYGDSAVMAAFLTRDFSSVGGEFEDSMITTLKNYAFAGITNLRRLSLPSITIIPTCAFYLTEISGTVTIPWSNITKIGSAAFYGGNALKESSLSLPVLRQIGSRAFMEQSDLTSFSAPALEEIIAENTPFEEFGGAFEGSGLQTFSAPILQATSNAQQLFKNCVSLTSVTMPNQTVVAASMFEGCTSLKSISLPRAIYCTGDYGFRNCSALTSVSLPTVQSVTANYLFYGCSSLEDISLPEAQGNAGMYLFSQCSALKTVSLPKITALSSSCFRGCTSLTFVGLNIPLVTSLGSSCFQECTALTTFSSNSISYIGSSCFSDCANLENVAFSGVTAVPQNCFYNCQKLTEVEFSGAVVSFGDAAFRGCQLLDTIILSGVTTMPTISSDTFRSATLITNGLGSIYVPDGLVSAFQADSIWGLYNIEGMSDYAGQ